MRSLALERFFLALGLGANVFAATADDWKGRSIYQLLTDRFANTDDVGSACNTTERVYCGGTWRGVLDHLDYIQDLGFDAVWISPIVANIEGSGIYGEAYHGYWAQDIGSLNSHFGNASDLKALSDGLHTRGMFLMVDVVVNHLGALGDNTTIDYASYRPFSESNDFHEPCLIDYENQTSIEQCWIGDVNQGLPDLNTESQGVIDAMNSWIGSIVQEYDVDGIRIDTLKHVRADFWPDFAKAAGVYTIGEVLSDNLTYTAAYTGVVDAVLDYPTFFPLTTGFSTAGGNLTALKQIATGTQTSYNGNASITGLFLENHDQPRFQSLTSDQSLVQNAMAWPFVFDGIPILYYGQEHGFSGAGDPNNREALWSTAYSTSHPLVAHVKSLNLARRVSIAANDSFLETSATFIDQNSTTALAISKPPLLSLLTSVGNSTAATWTIPASSGLFKPGQKLVNVLTCSNFTAAADGSVTVNSTNGLPQIILPATALSQDIDLCKDLAEKGDGNDAVRGVLSVATFLLTVVGASLLANL